MVGNRDRASRVAGTGAICALLLAGCASVSNDEPVTVANADEAASLEITPSSIEPWGTAAPALAPNFTLTGDAALAKVLPTTERITHQAVDAFAGTLALGLPQSSSTSTLTQKQVTTLPAAPTDATSTDQTRTTTTGPGVVPTSTTGAPGGASLPTVMSATGDVGTDPVVAYRAANYLYQTVQLFDREIQNAPQRRCYAPYLVKFKIAVMPYRSRLPYALHTRIGFFENDATGLADRPTLDTQPPNPSAADSGTEQARSKAVAAAQDARRSADAAGHEAKAAKSAAARADLAYRRATGLPDQSFDEATQAAARAETDSACRERQVPMVLPIIAADDMQVALKSKAVEVAQQIGVALSLMQSGVGANLGANNLRQSLDAILSHDLSSSLTVTRSSENTLYLRIAPNNEPSGEPALVGQSYDIAVLLLVPISYLHAADDPQMKFDVVTEYRDARTGKILPSPNDTRRRAALDRTLAPFLSENSLKLWLRLKPQTKLYVGDKLSRAATALDVETMTTFLSCMPRNDVPLAADVANDVDREVIERGCTVKIEPKKVRFVMTAMGRYIADSSLKSGIVDVPRPADIGLPAQTVIVADNGTSAASALLSGVRGGGSARLQGYLDLKVKGTTEVRRIAATGSTLDPVAHTLTLTFPSPSTYKADKEDWADAGNTLTVEQICDDQREWCPRLLGAPYVMSDGIRLVTRPGDVAGTSKMTLAATASHVVYDGATGSLSVSLAKLGGNETATLSVSGADLVSATDSATGALQVTADGAVEPKNGYVTLALANVTAAAVTVTATAKVGTKPSGTAAVTRPTTLKPKAAGDK